MNLYVGNLSYTVKEDDMKAAFSAYGEVASVKIVMDRFSGKSRGFGFVEMSSQDGGQKAIDEANGMNLQGREIVVKKAVPKDDRNSNNNFRRQERRY